jgi:hypothetical protein
MLVKQVAGSAVGAAQLVLLLLLLFSESLSSNVRGRVTWREFLLSLWSRCAA